MNCRPCQCHGHALSCHYDATADDQTDEHYRGGGGVCDNCSNNTTGELLQVNLLSETTQPRLEPSFCPFLLSGKNCELCVSGFFRLEGSDPTSPDVCQPCECTIAGTVNSSVLCAQVLSKTPGQPL